MTPATIIIMLSIWFGTSVNAKRCNEVMPKHQEERTTTRRKGGEKIESEKAATN